MTQLFSQEAIEAAQASQRKWGPPACTTLAQYMVESACGKFEPAGSNNPFGIKAAEGQPYVTAMTTEFVDGKEEHIDQNFAKYASLAEAFDAHAKLLATSRYYRYAMAHCDNYSMFNQLMCPVYATAPTYLMTIDGVIAKYGLAAYNVHTLASTPTPGQTTLPPNPAPRNAAEAPGLSEGSLYWAQQRLNLWGHKILVDGVDGPETEGALKAFQEAEGLKDVDGMIGPETEAALKKDPPPETPAPAEDPPAKK